MLSVVMATRNDGYSGNEHVNPNYHAVSTINCIESLQDKGVEIIFVEWNPPEDRITFKEILRSFNVKVVTVNKEYQKLLDAEYGRLSFYEYLAKHIGIQFATNNNILITNPDNLFIYPLTGVDRLCTEGVCVRASRTDIVPTSINEPWSNCEKFSRLNTHITAAGCFTAFNKSMYNSVGGYDLVHCNWDCDNALVRKFTDKGIDVKFEYATYHYAHETKGKNFVLRPKVCGVEQKPISKEIIDSWFNYVSI